MRDLDLYLLVARRLVADGDAHPHSAFADHAVEQEADELVAKATAASELATVTLFGRPRLIDFTQYGPRGHYANDEASYGPDHPDLARVLLNLAYLLRTDGRIDEAEPMFRRALAIFEASYGRDHPHTAIARAHLAALEAAHGRGGAGRLTAKGFFRRLFGKR